MRQRTRYGASCLDSEVLGPGPPRRNVDMQYGVPAGLSLALFLTGCAHRDYPVVSQEYASVEAKDQETERAMRQLREADVAIGYESDKRLLLTVPPDFGHHLIVDIAGLQEAVVQATTNRQLAVVTMDPPMRMLPKADFDARVDEIESMLRNIGFHRVVFHLGSATGRPIYRE